MFKKSAIISLILFLTLPLVVLAELPPPPTGQLDITSAIESIINVVFIIFVGISVIMFIFAGILFVTANGDPGKIKTARWAVLWGVIGVIVALLSTSVILTIQGSLF